MVGIDDDCRMGKAPLPIGFMETDQVFIMVVRQAPAKLVHVAAQNGVSKPIALGPHFPAPKRNCCSCWAAAMELSITEISPLVGFFIPTGMPTPLAIMRCS